MYTVTGWKPQQLMPIHLFDNYVMITFLAWEPRSHESRRNAIGSRFMKMRLPGQGRIHDVIIEKVYYCFSGHCILRNSQFISNKNTFNSSGASEYSSKLTLKQ
jgi:hypothetical protein